MATLKTGTITGITGALSSHYDYWIAWTERDMNITNNTTIVDATVYVQKVGSYNVESSNNSHTLYIDGTAFTANPYIDMNPETTPRVLVSGSKTITHNGDGTKSISISSSGQVAYVPGATYDPESGSASGTVNLTTIPREASITSSVSFKAGNSIPLTFNNPANGYLKVDVYVHDGTDYAPMIKSVNMGRVTSGTVTFTTAEINAIYTQLGGVSRGSAINVRTYSDSGYSTQIGGTSSHYGTCTIPSRAIVTSGADLTIGNNLAYTITNPDGKYVKMQYQISGNAGWYMVKDQQNGTGTTGTFTMSETDNNNMYSRMPNVTSASAVVRAITYEHSDYTTQIGDYHTIYGTVSVNQTTNKPDFSTFTVSNLDKTIENTDKYSNILASNSISTLLGADTRMIKGYSKLRAVVTSANKMVAKNYATAVKYRFVSGSKNKEGNYSADSTVNLDIDNAENSTVSVTAYDSRSLTTAVTDSTSITNNAEYEAVLLWGMSLTRDNGVDSETKLVFSGSYWNEYFGGGTAGVQNTITAHYRYKESTVAWGTQTWNSITVTDTDGSLSFDDYINGDLGASGFDTEKSFDIEVRIYDKLTNTISEKTLSVGIPVFDITKDGVAVGRRYDATEGGKFQVLGSNVLETGWYPVLTDFSIGTDANGLDYIEITSATTDIVTEGMRVKVTQGGTVYYGIIHDVDTTNNKIGVFLSVSSGTRNRLDGTAISKLYFSREKTPLNFPVAKSSWSVTKVDTTTRSQSSPTSGTWYNLGGTAGQIDIPLGNWDLQYKVAIVGIVNTTSTLTIGCTLSTTNNSNTNSEFLSKAYDNSISSFFSTTFYNQGIIETTAETTYYLNAIAQGSSLNSIRFDCGNCPMYLRMTSAYI